ncbi:MFS transporter [Kineococcus terrestris]|uniref:MFS transporter n=1 Tax=Kineococcus terrestris TaxID=2044856 RepID=UPI0034DB3B1D
MPLQPTPQNPAPRHVPAPRRTGTGDRRPWLALAVLVLPVLLVSVDTTVLSFALPAISTALAPSGTQLLWIVDAYPLALAGLLILMGSLGDRFGRRRLLLVGATGFGVVSLLAAFATSAEQLVAARAALGVFGATLMPSTLSLLRSTFPDRERRRTAFAVWAGAFAGGAALGPVVGGWLLEHFWWGSVFLMNVPVMVLLLVLAPVFVRESKDPAPGPVDLLSAALAVVAMTGAVYGIKAVAKDGVAVEALLPLLAGAAVGVWFVRRQQSLRDPMLDVALFRVPVFRAAVLANLLSILGMTGMLFATSQYLQLVLDLRPVTAGLLLLPGAVVSISAGLLAARLARRYPLATLIPLGLLLGTAGYAVAATLGPGGADAGRHAVQLALAFVVLSAGAGLAETLTNDAILATAPAERAGAASAISETAYEVGAVLGTTVLGSLLTGVYRAGVEVPAAASAEQATAARETLGGAVEVSGALAGTDATALLESARAAFAHGVDATALAGVVLTLTAAVFVRRQLRRGESTGAAPEAGRTAPVAGTRG